MKKNSGKKTQTTFLRFEYQGLRWWLNDEHVNEENFMRVQEQEPERLVKIKKFFQPGVAKIKDIKITGISNTAYIETDYPSSY
jgi:hypothetical protein